jgi:hypothetical protein
MPLALGKGWVMERLLQFADSIVGSVITMRFAANGQSAETGSRKDDWIDTEEDRKRVEQGRNVKLTGDREFEQAVDAQTGELLWVYVKATKFVVITASQKENRSAL